MEHILGNEELKEHFRVAVRNNKVSHAYILEGEKGSGKKLMAAAIARLLQCESSRTFDESPKACGACRSCIMVDHGDHPDVIWVRHGKPGVITVGEIREQVVNTVDIKPYKGPFKIYIIDEAEKMNQAAQNAVLKTIEEPPGYALILFLTTNRGAFLPTILSRCVMLGMKPVPDVLVKKYLMEECRIRGADADFCTGFALGNVGKAKGAALSEEFSELKGISLSILRDIHELEDYEIIGRVSPLKKWKDNIQDYLDILLLWFRDILVLKATGLDSRMIFQDEYPVLRRQSDSITYENIKEIIDEIIHTEVRIRANVNFDTSMEMLLINIKNRFNL